jgi:hypothetical protein
MADIRFFCPTCGARLAIDASVAGYRVDCPECGQRLTIPSTSDPAMDPPPAEEVPGQTLTPEEIELLSKHD